MTDDKQNLDNPTPNTDPIIADPAVNNGQPAAEPITPVSDQMIPKSRFDEINDKYKDATKRADAAEKATKKVQEDKLKEQEDYKSLYEQASTELAELRPVADQFESNQETLANVLESEIENIPEDLRALIPDELNTQQKLNWISKNKSLLLKPVGPDIGAGARGAGGDNNAVKLTAQEQRVARQFGLSDEEYATNKDKDA